MTQRIQFEVSARSGQVDGLWCEAENPRAVIALAHGAGADMYHRFMESISTSLVQVGFHVLRYQFPYSQQKRRVPDHPARLMATVRAACMEAAARAPNLPLLAGGKSMGGRMTSMAAATLTLPSLAGLVFLGFPLHTRNNPSTQRAQHLRELSAPLLFVQGSRDALADLELLKTVLKPLGARATLAVIEGADHAFAIPKRLQHGHETVDVAIAKRCLTWFNSL